MSQITVEQVISLELWFCLVLEFYYLCLDFGTLLRSLQNGLKFTISCQFRFNRFMLCLGFAGQFVSLVTFSSCRVNPQLDRVVFVSRFSIIFVSRVVYGSHEKKN